MAEGTRQAFAPGHASGFFSPTGDRSPEEANGSTGAGICLELGALSEVTVEPGDGDVQVDCTAAVGETPDELPVTETAIELLVGRRDVDVEVRTQFQLPLGHGLGMSGAGALSTTLALAPLLEQGRLEAVKAAHLAELRHLTGLGDVPAQIHGGVVVRRAAGIPPYGSSTTIPGDARLVLATLDGDVEQQAVLSDRDRMQRVAALGDQALTYLLEQPNLDRFFQVSRAFADQAGFLTDDLRKVLASLDEHGHATVALIGRTVVAYGDVDEMKATLGEFAEPRIARVSRRGAGRVQA